jgi:hypothetical protein
MRIDDVQFGLDFRGRCLDERGNEYQISEPVTMIGVQTGSMDHRPSAGILTASHQFLIKNIFRKFLTHSSAASLYSPTVKECRANLSADYSRTIFRASLSSRSPAKLACRRWPSGVHSVNSICATSRGFSHRQFSISSLVRP